MVPFRDRHTVVRRRADCAQLFFVYTGLRRRMQLAPLEFMQRTSIIDRNMVVFRDLFEQLYQRGIGPQVGSLPAFLRWQEELLGKFPSVRHRYCIGTSGGGYAALLSGYLLRADVVWAFAPMVRIQDNFRVSAGEHGLSEETYERYTDMTKLLAEGNGKTEYRIYYNRHFAPDVQAISALEGLPGVQLFPQDGADHFVVQELARTNMLSGLLPAFEEV